MSCIQHFKDNAFNWLMAVMMAAVVLLFFALIHESVYRTQLAYDYADKYNCFVVGRMQADSRQFAFVCNNQVILRRF